MADTSLFNKLGTIIVQIATFLSNTLQRRYSQNHDIVSMVENTYPPILSSPKKGNKIRDQLREWQQQQRFKDMSQRISLETHMTGTAGATRSQISQSGVVDSLNITDRQDLSFEENCHPIGESIEALSENPYKRIFLKKGDVVDFR